MSRFDDRRFVIVSEEMGGLYLYKVEPKPKLSRKQEQALTMSRNDAVRRLPHCETYWKNKFKAIAVEDL